MASPDRTRPEDVRRIVAMEDVPHLRNLLITQTYHELLLRLNRRLGGADVNWCAFATWASKTAGRFIRQEELPRALRDLLEGKAALLASLRQLHQELHSVHSDAAGIFSDDELSPILDVLDEVALYVRRGNRIVFAELGEAFADFLSHFEEAAERDERKLETFLERFRPGESLPDRVERGEDDELLSIPQGGQDVLRTGFRRYYEAFFETGGKRKAELVCLGNALCGLHEQIRLQPYIAGSLDAPVGELLSRRIRKALARKLPPEAHSRAQAVLDRVLGPIADELSESFRELSTELLMTTELPTETLNLGCDLPAPVGRGLYPASLARIEDGELATLWREYGPPEKPASRIGLVAESLLAGLRLHRPTVRGSGADDWARLRDRMRFILAYFRSRQEEPSLLEPPFDAEQTRAILAGELPSGKL